MAVAVPKLAQIRLKRSDTFDYASDVRKFTATPRNSVVSFGRDRGSVLSSPLYRGRPDEPLLLVQF